MTTASTEPVNFRKQEFDPEVAIDRLKPLLINIGVDVLTIRESGNMGVTNKTSDADIVTRADKLAEQMIVSHIKYFYPNHRVRGEEGTNIKSESAYEWIIDPIDGTTNFANGMDFFGISVGLYKDGEGLLGIMYFPALGELTWAVKGRGAFVNGVRVAIAKTDKELKRSLIAAGLIRGTEDVFPRLKPRTRNTLMGGSFTTEALWLIEGKIDAYVHTGATPYDLAAARIIVEVAGGVSSGIKDNGINLADEKIPIILAKSESLVRELRALLNS